LHSPFQQNGHLRKPPGTCGAAMDSAADAWD
jgi:hypothetical protein